MEEDKDKKPLEEKTAAEKKVYGVIYCLTNLINGKKYVGQTTRTIEERFREHAKTDSFIGKAIRKYGRKNFKIEELEKCYSEEELNAAEIKWIKELDCKAPNGYNLTGGGAGVVNLLKVIIERRAKKMTGRKGHPSFWKGKKMPAESCEKMSVAKKGKAPWNKGKKMTDEYCATMSAARKGKKLPYKRKSPVITEEARQNMNKLRRERCARNRVKNENIRAAETSKNFNKTTVNYIRILTNNAINNGGNFKIFWGEIIFLTNAPVNRTEV